MVVVGAAVVVDDNDDNDSSSWVDLLKTPLLQGQEEEWNDGNDAMLRQVNNGGDNDDEPYNRTTAGPAKNVEGEEGVKETEGSAAAAAAAAPRNKMNNNPNSRRKLWWWWLGIRVVLLHGFLVPYVFANMYWSISDYQQSHLILGLEFPVLTFTMIGLAVPVELYLSTVGIVILAGVTFNPLIAYHTMLVTCLILTILIGYKKFRSLQRMEYENMKNRKKHDDCDTTNNNDDYYDDDENVMVEPIPAGELLDELRLQETIRRREKKYTKQRMKDEILAVYTGIAILDNTDSTNLAVDTIVV